MKQKVFIPVPVSSGDLPKKDGVYIVYMGDVPFLVRFENKKFFLKVDYYFKPDFWLKEVEIDIPTEEEKQSPSVSPLVELIEWMDSEDCRIDQYAVQQLTDKINELLSTHQQPVPDGNK